MLLTLALPRIHEYMTTAVIATVHAAEGDQLTVGSKFVDLVVDLSAIAPHDCPPVSLFRIALRDRVWLRRINVAPGDQVEVGAVLAQFTTEPDETTDGEPARAPRITLAGIVQLDEWWEGSAP